MASTPLTARREDDDGSVRQINQYTLEKKLGRGSFAEVYLAKSADLAAPVACKVFNKSLLRRKRTMARTADGVKVTTELDKVQTEIAIMKKLEHNRLVRLYEVVDDDECDALYMFMEHVEKGPVMVHDPSTNTFAAAATGGPCGEPLAAAYLLDVASGLGYLHLHGIAHRDLKPDNVLLGHDGFCKIADFGVAHVFDEQPAGEPQKSLRSLERSHSVAQTGETQGTYSFWSPEMVEGEGGKFNAYSCDCWAAGVCFYIFLTGRLPFYAEEVMDLFGAIEAAAPDIPADLPDGAKRVLAGLMEKDVDKRLTVPQLEADEWLAGVAAARQEETDQGKAPHSMLARLSVSAHDVAAALSPVKAKKHNTFFDGAKKLFKR